MTEIPHVILTGSSGFLGQAVRQSLGKRASCLSLRDPSWKSNPSPVEGSVVVHLAGLAHQRAREDEYHRVNVELTLAFAGWAEQRGAKRFIFFSSSKALGEESPLSQSLGPEHPCRPTDPYGQSKQAAEEALRARFHNSPMEIVILRAPLIYGPGVKGNLLWLMRLLASGIPMPIRAWRSNLRSIAGLSNVVSCIELCLHHPDAGHRTFHISDGEDVSTGELICRLAEALGVKARELPLGPCFLEKFFRGIGQGELYQKLAGNFRLDIQDTRQVLGWRPITPMKDEVAKMVKYFQNTVIPNSTA
jgi:UDP-glucose 4-epimerase